MKHVKLFESWNEEVEEKDEFDPELEAIAAEGEEAEEAEAEEAEEAEAEEDEMEATGETASWEGLKGEILDKYKNGEISKDEAIEALG